MTAQLNSVTRQYQSAVPRSGQMTDCVLVAYNAYFLVFIRCSGDDGIVGFTTFPFSQLACVHSELFTLHFILV